MYDLFEGETYSPYCYFGRRENYALEPGEKIKLTCHEMS